MAAFFEKPKTYFAAFSHGWFATPQDVLQADWQEVWHSPQPPVFTLSFKSRVAIVLILSMNYPSPRSLENKFLSE